MDKKDYEIVAAIDVGTNQVQMIIAQVNENGKKTILEELKNFTTIGNDVFTVGKINIATMYNIVIILKGFRRILKEYKIKNYKAVATSAFREAENREYVLEYIRFNSGIQIEVINNSQERFYMYQALMCQRHIYEEKPSTLVLNIASGGVEVSIHEKGELKLMEYMNIGALRIHEMFSGCKNRVIDFSDIMEEYIFSRLSRIAPVIKTAKINSFIGLGGEINTICSLCKNKKGPVVDSSEIHDIYQKIKGMTNDKLTEVYGLTSKQADTLLPSIILLNSMLGMVDTKYIDVPMIELKQGIICDLSDQLFNHLKKEETQLEIVRSAWYINKKFGLERMHAEKVAALCVSIFEQTIRLHNLGDRECLFLQIAAILHGLGYYINYYEQAGTTYELIKKQNIMGLSNHELELVANIAFYYGNEVPRQYHENYQKLTFHDKIIVVKLAAILKLADSLDASHIGKISMVKIEMHGELIHFIIHTKEHTWLEEWVFSQRTQFFEEVMGVKPHFMLKH